jgi:hypothetical protein
MSGTAFGTVVLHAAPAGSRSDCLAHRKCLKGGHNRVRKANSCRSDRCGRPRPNPGNDPIVLGPTGHPDYRSQSLWMQFQVNRRSCTRRSPALEVIVTYLLGTKRAKFVHETDRRIKLWVACQALLDPGHFNQHAAYYLV